MPIYEYECTECGRVDERLLPISDTSEQTCACGSRMKRLISSFSVCIPAVHRAVNHAEASLAEAAFKAPSRTNPGGVSDEELVRKGLATTRACSNWWGDTRGRVEAKPKPEPRKVVDPPGLRERVREAIRSQRRK